MTAPSKNLPKSLLDNPLLGTWIGFEETGRVRLATGKVEIGQGVLTALAQIAAEELDVTPARLRVVSGETPTSPREGFTSGSNSIAVSGASIRLVCAEVRTLFLRHVADRLACPVGALSIEDGRFMRAGRHVGQDYWSIARDIDLARPAAADAAPKPPSNYRIVGQSLPRLDLADKVAGAAFIHDLAPDNLLHARMLRRPWPGARLTDLDETAVRRAAGAPIDILRAGDLVAFTSDDELAVMRAAQSARELAVWTGGAKPPADAGEPDWIRSQRARDRIVETGTAAAPAGNRVVEATFSRPFLAYGSIGPSCALAQNKSGKLTVWTHSQGVFELRKWLSHALGWMPLTSRCCIGKAPAATGTTLPMMRRSMPPSSRCGRRTGRCACNGRARTSSRPRPWARPWSSGCARCSTPIRARPTGRSISGARSTPSVRA